MCLLSIVSKILEGIVFRRLCDHYLFFSCAQCDFRKTINDFPITQSLQKVYQGIENQNYFDVIFTDYIKASNRVEHGLFLKKLYETRIRKQLLKLFESYLTNRALIIRIKSVYSKPIKIIYNLLHGIILKPILFIVFVNELPKRRTRLFSLFSPMMPKF